MKWGRSIALVIAVAGLAALLAPSASAAPAAPSGCAEEVMVEQTIYGWEIGQPGPRGVLQLRHDNCGNYWTYVRYDQALGPNEPLEAQITRFDNGERTATASCGNDCRTTSASMTEYATAPVSRDSSMSQLFHGFAIFIARMPRLRGNLDTPGIPPMV